MLWDVSFNNVSFKIPWRNQNSELYIMVMPFVLHNTQLSVMFQCMHFFLTGMTIFFLDCKDILIMS